MRGSDGACWQKSSQVVPLRVVARRVVDGLMADLAATDGRVAVAGYGSGPDELTFVLVAELRYLVEQTACRSPGCGR